MQQIEWVNGEDNKDIENNKQAFSPRQKMVHYAMQDLLELYPVIDPRCPAFYRLATYIIFIGNNAETGWYSGTYYMAGLVKGVVSSTAVFLIRKYFA